MPSVEGVNVTLSLGVRRVVRVVFTVGDDVDVKETLLTGGRAVCVGVCVTALPPVVTEGVSVGVLVSEGVDEKGTV